MCFFLGIAYSNFLEVAVAIVYPWHCCIRSVHESSVRVRIVRRSVCSEPDFCIVLAIFHTSVATWGMCLYLLAYVKANVCIKQVGQQNQ